MALNARQWLRIVIIIGALPLIYFSIYAVMKRPLRSHFDRLPAVIREFGSKRPSPRPAMSKPKRTSPRPPMSKPKRPSPRPAMSNPSSRSTPTTSSVPPIEISKQTKKFLNNIKTITITPQQRSAYIKTVKEFDRFWRQLHNKTYFLYAGTLLGAYRHSNFVPWDDDFDIIIDAKDIPFLINAGKKSSVFEVVETRPPLIKFHLRDPKLTQPAYLWRWPFLDVWRFGKKGENVTHVGLSTPKSDIFPLIELPVGDMMLPVPRCAFKLIKQQLGSGVLRDCQVSHYSHQHEKGRREGGMTIPCQPLRKLFSFIDWRRLNSSHSEQWISPAGRPPHRGRTVYMPEC